MSEESQAVKSKRYNAMGRALNRASAKLDFAEGPVGELLDSAILTTVRAIFPGRQRVKQVESYLPKVRKAVLRQLELRTKSPNPHKVGQK